MNKWMNLLLLRINLHSLNSSSSPKLDLWRTSGSRQNADLLLQENSTPWPRISVPTTLQSLSETFIKLSSLLKSAQIMFSYNHTMLPGPITSWQTEGEKVETVTDFIFLISKITTDSNWSHEIQRCLFFGRKANKARQHIKKQRHHFVDKGLYIQSYDFSSSHVWCKKWAIKRLKCWKMDAFELWCLRDSWTARKSNQSILQEIIAEYSLDRLIFEAEVSILWPCDAKSWLTRKDPDSGKEWSKRRGWWRTGW